MGQRSYIYMYFTIPPDIVSGEYFHRRGVRVFVNHEVFSLKFFLFSVWMFSRSSQSVYWVIGVAMRIFVVTFTI